MKQAVCLLLGNQTLTLGLLAPFSST